MIDIHEGEEPRERLELLYHQTERAHRLKESGSLFEDYENDYAALQPLLRDLFDRERTVENAQDLRQVS